MEYVKNLSRVLNLQYRKLFNLEQELTLKYETFTDEKLLKMDIESIKKNI